MMVGIFWNRTTVTGLKRGDVFAIEYPFVHDIHASYDHETFIGDVPCWRPGVIVGEHEATDGAPIHCASHGLGTQTLRVVQVCVVGGKYAPRVFYTREWTDPDGKAFGKRKLRISALPSFCSLLKGYRFPFVNLKRPLPDPPERPTVEYQGIVTADDPLEDVIRKIFRQPDTSGETIEDSESPF